MIKTALKIASVSEKKATTRTTKKTAASKPTRGMQARALTTRDTILRAAIRVFSKDGLSGGRVETISKMARTHDRMIYYYFGSKEKLFIEVLETIYQRMNDAEAALQIDIEDPQGSLTAVVHFTWQYYLDHPEFITLLNSENMHRGKHVSKSAHASELSLPAVSILNQILRAGAAQGLFRHDIEARDLYVAIAALGYFYLSNRYTLSTFLSTDLMAKEAVAHWRDFITDFVLRSVMDMPQKQAKRRASKSAPLVVSSLVGPPHN